MKSFGPFSSAGLRAFPPEIREMIFDFTHVLEWTGKTPALIVALRGDQELYQEALELFYKRNTFKLHRGNDWTTRDMAPSALRSIRSLRIDFWSSDDWEEWSPAQTIEPPVHNFTPSSSSHPHPTLRHYTNLAQLTLDVSFLPEHSLSACLLPALTFARHLFSLERIVVHVPYIASRRCDDPYDVSGTISELVKRLNGGLGTAGKLLNVRAGEAGEVWFWEGGREGWKFHSCGEGPMERLDELRNEIEGGDWGCGAWVAAPRGILVAA